MTSKEMEVVGYLLYRRHQLYTKIGDDKIVDQILLNRETREDIRNKMGYGTNQVMSNMLSDLRKKKILMGDGINRGLIPNFTQGSDNFKLILNFSLSETG